MACVSIEQLAAARQYDGAVSAALPTRFRLLRAEVAPLVFKGLLDSALGDSVSSGFRAWWRGAAWRAVERAAWHMAARQRGESGGQGRNSGFVKLWCVTNAAAKRQTLSFVGPLGHS